MCLNERFSSPCMRRTQSLRPDSGKRHRREGGKRLGDLDSYTRAEDVGSRWKAFGEKNKVLRQNIKFVGQNKKFWGTNTSFGGATKKHFMLGGEKPAFGERKQKLVPCEFVCPGSAMKAKQRRWGGRSKKRRWDAGKEGKVTLRRPLTCAPPPGGKKKFKRDGECAARRDAVGC